MDFLWHIIRATILVVFSTVTLYSVIHAQKGAWLIRPSTGISVIGYDNQKGYFAAITVGKRNKTDLHSLEGSIYINNREDGFAAVGCGCDVRPLYGSLVTPVVGFQIGALAARETLGPMLLLTFGVDVNINKNNSIRFSIQRGTRPGRDWPKLYSIGWEYRIRDEVEIEYIPSPEN